MQNADKALSDFNAWWDRQPFRDQFEDMKQQMANVWLASRRELVVELPKINPSEWACTGDECMALQQGIQIAGRAVRAAGVTVRG